MIKIQSRRSEPNRESKWPMTNGNCFFFSQSIKRIFINNGTFILRRTYALIWKAMIREKKWQKYLSIGEVGKNDRKTQTKLPKSWIAKKKSEK